MTPNIWKDRVRLNWDLQNNKLPFTSEIHFSMFWGYFWKINSRFARPPRYNVCDQLGTSCNMKFFISISGKIESILGIIFLVTHGLSFADR